MVMVPMHRAPGIPGDLQDDRHDQGVRHREDHLHLDQGDQGVAQLRTAAIEAAAKAAVEVEGVAGELPAADEFFDAGIASLVLCSVRALGGTPARAAVPPSLVPSCSS